jgi:hypothetical protein
MAEEGKANTEFQKILDHAPNSVSDVNLVNITINPENHYQGLKIAFIFTQDHLPHRLVQKGLIGMF